MFHIISAVDCTVCDNKKFFDYVGRAKLKKFIRQETRRELCWRLLFRAFLLANEVALDPPGRLKHPREGERALCEGERGSAGRGWEGCSVVRWSETERVPRSGNSFNPVS